MAISRNSRTAVWMICSGLLLACIGLLAQMPQSAAPAKPAKPDDSTLINDFEARVNQYMDMRKTQGGNAPRSTNSPEKLTQTKNEIAQRVRAARNGAKQGEVFTPDIAGYFRRQITETLHGPDGARIFSSLRHAEPIKGLRLQVNGEYPEGVPLQSTPPSLLMNLPKLPKELEYRIVGRDLVLHDITPNLVVDLVPNAIPAS
jgi:hypothetical protein